MKLYLSFTLLALVGCGNSSLPSQLNLNIPPVLEVKENQLQVVRLSASGLDSKHDYYYALSGQDSNYFDIYNDVLSFKLPPDFENTAFYNFTVTINQDTRSDSKPLEVKVTDVPELNLGPHYPMGLTEFDYSYFENINSQFSVDPVFSMGSKGWGIKLLSDSLILASEQTGAFHLHNIEAKKTTMFSIDNLIDIYAQGQGGLFNFDYVKTDETTYVIYFTVSVNDSRGGPALALFKAELSVGEVSMLSNVVELFRTDANEGGYHFGGDIVIEGGDIFVTSGERERSNPQLIGNNKGKILRFELVENGDVIAHPDNSINTGVPYSEIFSLGHRNPQGIDYITEFGYVISSEHGPAGGDEINIINNGGNYGWPLVTLGEEYSGGSIGDNQLEGYEDALTYYIPSIAPRAILYIHENVKFPELNNSILLTSLKYEMILVVYFNQDRPTHKVLDLSGYGRISAIDVSSMGEIYFVTHGGDGNIFRISPWM